MKFQWEDNEWMSINNTETLSWNEFVVEWDRKMTEYSEWRWRNWNLQWRHETDWIFIVHHMMRNETWRYLSIVELGKSKHIIKHLLINSICAGAERQKHIFTLLFHSFSKKWNLWLVGRCCYRCSCRCRQMLWYWRDGAWVEYGSGIFALTPQCTWWVHNVC